MDNKETEISVVMVPLPAQSHLNQLLHLAAAISSSDHRLPVHFLGSATHNRQAKLRSHGLINPNSTANKIQFHDLPTPPIATPDPDPNPPGRIPIHNAPAFTAYSSLRPLIGEFVQELAKNFKRIVIIYDRYIAEAVGDAVSTPNVESYAFNCLSGFNLFYILWETLGKPFDLHDRINETFSVRDLMPDFVISFLVTKPDYFHDRAGDIHNTSRVIEGDYIDLLSRKEINNGVDKKQWAITPLILLRAKSKNIMINHDDDQKLRGRRDKCLEWLDKQSPRSVIYVSFGTLVSLSEEEVGEIAKGLEESKQKFIWVVREADIADIFAREGRRIEMPDGFEERVKENGIVVRDWAPQLEILAHKSTGGFMSHCGWNSCLESLTMGVPIAAWPMHSDQPLNAILLTQVLKTGLIVRQWAEGVVEAVKSSVIKNAVERLMASEEGYQIRKRAEEISAAINESMEEGGQCSRELEAFITHITR